MLQKYTFWHINEKKNIFTPNLLIGGILINDLAPTIKFNRSYPSPSNRQNYFVEDGNKISAQIYR